MTTTVHASKYITLVFTRHTGLEQHEREEMLCTDIFLRLKQDTL